MGRWTSGSSVWEVCIELGYVDRGALEIKDKAKVKRKEGAWPWKLQGNPYLFLTWPGYDYEKQPCLCTSHRHIYSVSYFKTPPACNRFPHLLPLAIFSLPKSRPEFLIVPWIYPPGFPLFSNFCLKINSAKPFPTNACYFPFLCPLFCLIHSKPTF